MNLNPFSALERKAQNFSDAHDAVEAQLVILDQNDVPLFDAHAQDCKNAAKENLVLAREIGKKAVNIEAAAVTTSGFSIGFMTVLAVFHKMGMPLNSAQEYFAITSSFASAMLFIKSISQNGKQQEYLNKANNKLFEAMNSLTAVRHAEKFEEQKLQL